MFVCLFFFLFNLVTLFKHLLGLLVQSTLQYLCYIFTLFGNCLGFVGFFFFAFCKQHLLQTSTVNHKPCNLLEHLQKRKWTILVGCSKSFAFEQEVFLKQDLLVKHWAPEFNIRRKQLTVFSSIESFCLAFLSLWR